MQYPPVFVKVRKLIEPLAVRLGDERLKEACCQLLVDSGDGRQAIKALANLRAVGYRVYDVEQARNLLARQLASMGLGA